MSDRRAQQFLAAVPVGRGEEQRDQPRAAIDDIDPVAVGGDTRRAPQHRVAMRRQSLVFEKPAGGAAGEGNAAEAGVQPVLAAGGQRLRASERMRQRPAGRISDDRLAGEAVQVGEEETDAGAALVEHAARWPVGGAPRPAMRFHRPAEPGAASFAPQRVAAEAVADPVRRLQKAEAVRVHGRRGSSG